MESFAWFYIIFWITISCTMILFNKAVLDQFKFPYPIFLTTWHMMLATVLTQIMARTTTMLPGVTTGKVDRQVFVKSIIPVAVCFSSSLIFSNKAYIYLSVSYIQMLKAFTPVAVLGFSAVCGLEKPKPLEVAVVMMICVGVAITSVGEAYFSWIGFTFQSIGIISETARLVLTNVLMKQIKLDPLSSLYYIAPACSVLLLFLFVIFELPDFPFDRLMQDNFHIVLIINGFVAFLLNVAVVLLIGNASALILTLAGIVKDVMLVFLSVIVLGSTVTPLQYVGYSIALLGLNVHKEYKKYEHNIEEWFLYQYLSALVRPKNAKPAYELVPKKESQANVARSKLVQQLHDDESA